MNNRIDLTQFEELIESIVICEEEYIKGSDNLLEDCQTLKDRMQITLAELKRCYKQIDLLTKAFMMAGEFGLYMTICEECDDVHTLDDECPFICEYCGEKGCECPTSE